MMDYFMNRQKLFDIFPIDNKSNITKEFSVLLQNLWCSIKFSPDNFLIIISELTNSIKNDEKVNYSSVRGFISFLLETMHYELNGGNNMNFNTPKLVGKCYNSINELKNDYYSKNNSEIQNIFFFEIEIINKCNCQINKEDISYSINYYLYTSIEKFIKESSINTLTLIGDSLKKNSQCKNCLKNNYNYLKFNRFPEVLLVIVDDPKQSFQKKNFFIVNEEIDLKNYSSKSNKDNKTKYKLKCLLLKAKNSNEYISICKSPINNKLYKYKNEYNNVDESNDFNLSDSIPILLVYQKSNK